MKIAHITWSLGTGGIETMLADIVNEQIISEKVAVYIINNYVDEDIINKINKNCKLIFCGKKIGSKNILPIIKLNWELIKFNPDIIHIHLPGIIKLIPFIRCKKVFTIHNTHTTNQEYSHFDALYGISNAVKDYTRKQGYESITIYNGINISKIKSKNNFEKPSKYKILQIGRLYNPHKGQHILLKAIKKLVYQKGVQNFIVDFIGEGPSLKELQVYVDKNNLQQYVNFVGLKSRDYIYEHLCDYHLYIQPSLSEGFGLTIAEAMVAKVPVIVSNLEGPMEVINNGELGDFFTCGDYKELASKIAAFMEKNMCVEKIHRAHEYAIKHFSVINTANKYLYEYNKLL